jgi:hypothetical protein
MFASLPHAVNFFSKTRDQYYIAVAFLYCSMLQAVQFVQYTVRTNIHHKPPTLYMMEAAEKKISSFLLTLYKERLSFFSKYSVILFKNEKTL